MGFVQFFVLDNEQSLCSPSTDFMSQKSAKAVRLKLLIQASLNKY